MILLLPLIDAWLHFTRAEQPLVLLGFGSLTIPLPGSSCRVLKNISLSLHNSTLRYYFISVASAVIKLFVTQVCTKIIYMRPGHWHYTARMSSLCESRNVLTLCIVGTEWVVQYLNAIFPYQWLNQEVWIWFRGKSIPHLLLLDSSNFFFRLMRGTFLLMCVQIYHKNQVATKLTFTAVLNLLFRNWLVMVLLLHNNCFQLLVRSLIAWHYKSISLLIVNWLILMLLFCRFLSL